MVGRSNPFFDKYFRYTISWLLFGVFGIAYLWQWGWLYVAISAAVAFFLSFGLDIIFVYIVKQKTKAMVNEAPIIIVDAVRLRKEKRGYLVLTKKFVLFVPVFNKIKTVFDAEQIVRYEADNLQLDITAKFPNQYRTFSYSVISKKKLLPQLEEMTGQSLPYKFEKVTNSSM